MQSKKIVIITAPSGSGKTTLIKRLMNHFPELTFSISACTRPPRLGEIDGKDYHFISPERFKQAIEANEFIEWEMVYEGKYYGTLKSELNRIWDKNQIPLVDIDVKGALNVQEQYRSIALSIFIQAPSIEILKNRLEQRGTETEESLSERVKKASYELSFANQFDHILINDDLELASEELLLTIRHFLNH